MSKPIIGITTGRYNRVPKPELRQGVLFGCPKTYATAVLDAGGAPVLLARTDDKDAIADVMARTDALLLSGGGDMVSLLYGEEPHPKTTYQDPVRDRMELEAIRIALERGVPILGICRGIQVLNVAMGGTLVQDVGSEVPDAHQHYTHARDTVLSHTVDVEEDSLLARVLGMTSTPTNSWHHQAVKEPGKGLRISARARDGVVEAIEADDGRPVLAVQWHPEDCCDEYPPFQKLFDWLVESAAGAARGAESEDR